MTYQFSLIDVDVVDGVATATIRNPPVNLIDAKLFGELSSLADKIATDDEVRVLVLKSADRDFFIAHFDVEAILAVPIEGEPKKRSSFFSDLCDKFRTMPKVTIAQIEGRAGGGGSELALAMDMRFGVIGKTSVSQKEAAVGLLAGGGGTQRLPRLVGRGRALEILLGHYDIDAETAERWGYLNRILLADEIDGFVQNLARRVATVDPEVLALTKAAVDQGDEALREGLAEESHLFAKLLRHPPTRDAMTRFVEADGQSREMELQRFRLEDIVPE